MRAKLHHLLSFVPFALAAFPLAGHAAPQILGLVATATPLPLTCADGVCSAEVSGVCLQEQRPSPEPGTAYRLAAGSAVAMVVHRPDGTARTVDIGRHAAFNSLRVFSSVKVALPERLVRELAGDGARVSLSVGPMTSLLPVALPGDPSPLTEKEIRAHTGPLRAIAEDAIGRDRDTLAAMRALNHMVNVLPADLAAGSAPIASLRERFLGGGAAVSPGTAKFLDRAFDTCRERIRVQQHPHLRGCLANQHDILNSDTTQAVWRHLRPGS
jgi:hypothetical protein